MMNNIFLTTSSDCKLKVWTITTESHDMIEVPKKKRRMKICRQSVPLSEFPPPTHIFLDFFLKNIFCPTRNASNLYKLYARKYLSDLLCS